MIESRLLRYVVQVAEARSFTRAAESLRIAQPTLSAQIRQLEDQLRCTLFDRSRRRIVATEAGDRFVVRARSILAQLEELEVVMGDYSAARTGRLRVGAVQTVSGYLLPTVMSHFRRALPGVHLQLEELPAPDIGDELRAGRLDVGLSFDEPMEPGLECEPLFEEELVLIRRKPARTEASSNRRRICASQLVERELALLDNRFCTRRLADSWAREAGHLLEPVCEQSSIGGLLSLVHASDLCTVLPRLAITLPAARGLAIERLGPNAPSRGVAFFHRPDPAQPILIDAFRDAVHAAVAECLRDAGSTKRRAIGAAK